MSHTARRPPNVFLVGGSEATQCLGHRTGILCGYCAPGYEETNDRRCSDCSGFSCCCYGSLIVGAGLLAHLRYYLEAFAVIVVVWILSYIVVRFIFCAVSVLSQMHTDDTLLSMPESMVVSTKEIEQLATRSRERSGDDTQAALPIALSAAPPTYEPRLSAASDRVSSHPLIGPRMSLRALGPTNFSDVAPEMSTNRDVVDVLFSASHQLDNSMTSIFSLADDRIITQQLKIMICKYSQSRVCHACDVAYFQVATTLGNTTQPVIEWSLTCFSCSVRVPAAMAAFLPRFSLRL